MFYSNCKKEWHYILSYFKFVYNLIIVYSNYFYYNYLSIFYKKNLLIIAS